MLKGIKLEFGDDCRRIQNLLVDKHNVWFSLTDCKLIWEAYSEMFSSGWLILPKDDRDLLDVLEDTLDNLEHEHKLYYTT